jgi:hypothetical protein
MSHIKKKKILFDYFGAGGGIGEKREKRRTT